ncbi:MAG: hypothetical protein HW386_476 [Gammaproteobacteria bacterium]|nr:hypothetical protein [Gammaproteobacteria bacterium]
MLIALFTWLLLDESHWAVIYDRMAITKDYNHLGELNQKLVQENASLSEKILMMESAAELDKKTALLLQQDVQSLQDEIYHFKGELDFYNGIMDATRAATGLNIQGIHIDTLPQERSFRMKLILTHVEKFDKGAKLATGTMTVSIEGIQNGATSQLNLQDITLDHALELSFSFRNFKRFESDLEFPEGFSPRRVLVQLQPNGGKQTIIKRVFDWPELTS